MASVTTSVEDLIDANPNVNNRESFDALWAITCSMFDKVKARFELNMDPSTADLQPYYGKDGAQGFLSAYSGPQMDWLIHSWTGNPGATFTNMHLTINLGQHIDVPNFGFALGTMPDLFWYMDTMPRRELVTNPDYVDRYWSGEANQAYMAQLATPNFNPFVSRDPYTRVALSPNAFVYSAPITPEVLANLEAACHAGLDRWLAWVDAATPVTAEESGIMATRDLFIRKTICERDPANVIAERLFGVDMTKRLVATLWGGNRTLPRPF
jgi:Red chlorophyll catabolite reductase (RCC reductase)